MKTLKLLGIVLLSALFVIGMTACPEEQVEELDDLNGSDLRVFSLYGPYTNKTLTAEWKGDPEDVTIIWYMGDLEKNRGKTFIPIDKGTYTIVLEAEGYNPLEKTFTIEDAPTHIDYIGEWKMDYTDAKNIAWKNDTTNGGDYNETVVITKDHYRLQSDKKSAPKNETDEKDEFFYMTIESAVPKSDAVSVTIDDIVYATGAVTLNGKLDPDDETGQHGGYKLPTDGFTLQLNEAKTEHVSDRNNIKRVYVRQSRPVYITLI